MHTNVKCNTNLLLDLRENEEIERPKNYTNNEKCDDAESTTYMQTENSNKETSV